MSLRDLDEYLGITKVKKILNDVGLSKDDVSFLMQEYGVFYHHLEKKLTTESILKS